jgi:hypothetical protein
MVLVKHGDAHHGKSSLLVLLSSLRARPDLSDCHRRMLEHGPAKVGEDGRGGLPKSDGDAVLWYRRGARGIRISADAERLRTLQE